MGPASSIAAALIGPPGAGKTTLANALVNLGYLLVRVRGPEPACARSGELLADGMASLSVTQQLDETPPGAHIVIDGFPRTLSQAKALDTWATRSGAHIVPVLIEPADAELRLRMISRSKSCQRPDDDARILARRQLIYFERTTQIVRHYETRGCLARYSNEPTRDISHSINAIVTRQRSG